MKIVPEVMRMYEAPKIGDLGQIFKHVLLVNGPVFSPDGDREPIGQGTGVGTGIGNQVSTPVGPAAGAGVGLAGLGLIGALFAGLASRSSNETPTKMPPEVPTESGRSEP